MEKWHAFSDRSNIRRERGVEKKKKKKEKDREAKAKTENANETCRAYSSSTGSFDTFTGRNLSKFNSPWDQVETLLNSVRR